MHEDSVTLHVRPSDERAVGQAAAAAVRAYEDISGRSVHFSVQCTLPRDRYAQYPLLTCTFLPMLSEYSAGGVRLVSGTERITIDNTLDERLRLLEEQVRYFPTLQ